MGAVSQRATSLSERGVLASVGAFTFLAVLLIGLFTADSGTPVPGGTSTVVVRAGDTLWGMADRYAPNSDPRAVVRRIVELNGLDRTTVAAGDTLRVPTAR